MEKFMALPEDKQKKIIDAALQVFGENTYSKASTGNIAAAAEISKGMVFHYFGSKRALYFYLIELCGNLLTSEREKHLDHDVTDFFDKIKLATNIKVTAIKKHPALLAFLKNVYFETDSEVVDEIREKVSHGVANSRDALMEKIDTTKFKDPSSHGLLMKLLAWASEGLMENRFGSSGMDERIEDYFACLDLLKANFYKGECCNE